MFLGLGVLSWVFWLCLLAIMLSLVVIVFASRRRAWWIVGINATCIMSQAIVALGIWLLLGECLLPHSAVIEYQEGMSLCPGQAAIITVPIPAAGKNI